MSTLYARRTAIPTSLSTKVGDALSALVLVLSGVLPLVTLAAG